MSKVSKVSTAKNNHLPLSDSPYIGDTLLTLLASARRDIDALRNAIHQLKDNLHSAVGNNNDMDEDTMIERLFSGADIEFENRWYQDEIPLANGKSYTIHTTEVVDNITVEERDVQSEDVDLAPKSFWDEQELAQATLCCCEEFLSWVLERLDEPHVYGCFCVPFPFEAVYNFVQDLSATGLISGFCQSTTPREKQTSTLRVFGDIENFTFFNLIPNNPTREMMSIFALRQMLESWFMRIVGFRGVVPSDCIDIRSGRFQKIIENGFEENFKFPPKIPPVTFKSIQRIYQWTQASIHWAYTTNVWLLWKAMTYCERLFGATIEKSALENYRKEIIKLCLEEAKFTKPSPKTQNPHKDRPDERVILFRDPDIFVKDAGKTIEKFSVNVNGLSGLERNVIIRNRVHN